MYPIQNVSDTQLVFPTNTGGMIPDYETIPDEFKHGNTKWNRLFNDWFFRGLEKYKIIPKDGVNLGKALRHIRYVMGSWEPKHEHKEAGVVFLMNEWFKDATWKKKKSKIMGEKKNNGVVV